jgi:hypothetical protein
MSALTFAQAKTLIGNQIGETDTAFTDDVATWLNQSQRAITRARPWPELLKIGSVITAEPYSTGTVSVTTNDTAVTGAATVFPTDAATALYRWAPSYSQPYHTVSVRGGDTALTLATHYRGATLSASPYVLYRVDLSLPTDCEVIDQIKLHDHRSGEIITLTPVGPYYLERWSALPESAGRPVAYTDAIPPLTDGTKQIRVGPCAPDDTYRLEVFYRKSPTDGSASLPQYLEALWIQHATAQAYKRDSYQKYVAELNVYREMLTDLWSELPVPEGHLSYGQERVERRGDDYPLSFNLDSLEI